MVGNGPVRLPPVDTVVLSASPGEQRAAVLRGGAVWGLDWEWPDRPSRVGAVFAVRVTRLAPEAKGAFVVTDERGSEGFLDLSRQRGPLPHEGQRLLAQATRLPEDGKRLTLSPAIRLAGRYLVYTPGHAGVSASRQLPKAAAGPLQGVVKRTLRPDESAIVRAAAAALADAAERLLPELERHRAAWQALTGTSGLGLLRAAPLLAERLLLERSGTGPLTVIADSPRAQSAARAAAAAWAPGEPVTVTLDSANPFECRGGEEAMAQAAARHAPLRSGGGLWLEPTRAGWMADVDSGSGQGSAAALRLQTNLEAAVELARQVRLRQASGLFVTDFLRLANKGEEERVLQTLRAAFAEDPAPLRFNPAFDPLGFYAFSRGRVAPAFASRLDAGGHAQTLLAGLRGLVRDALAEPHRRLALHLSPAAVEAAGAMPVALREAEAVLGAPPRLEPDSALRPGQFAVRPQA